jgi:hypothetical protein
VLSALEQEPTTKNLAVDCISREQAKTAIRDKFKDLPSRVEINTILNELPSVTPQPCEDAISRKAVLNQIFYSTDNNGDVVLGSALRERIAELPSVAPQEPRKGHWIFVGEENEEETRNDNFRYICSECGYSDIHAKSTYVPYCWHCGAKMAEQEET